MSDIDALELLGIAREIAAEAGTLAVTMRTAGISVQTTKSNQLDIVTQADTAVEALIRQKLASARPGDGFLGEESGEVEGTSGVTWVVDPIDGTINYLYGSPNYTVSIAATIQGDDGRPTTVAGCVYAPALAAEYAAAAGHPALLNDVPIHVNDDVPLDKALVSTAVPYDLARRAQVLTDISALMPHIRDFRLVGGAALEICGVADGRTDAHVQRELPIWDYAAAVLIAAQAGAEVRGAKDSRSRVELLLVANPALVDALEPLLD